MRRNTKRNVKMLAAETLSQMDLSTMCEMVKDLLESHYEGLSDEEFGKEWKERFGQWK